MSRARTITLSKNETRRMEDEARKMECKMEALRRVMEAASDPKSRPDSGQGRWRSGAASKPITKGYVQSVLEAPKVRKSVVGASERRAADATMPKQLDATRGATPANLEDMGGGGAGQAVGGNTSPAKARETKETPIGQQLPNGAGFAKSGAAANLQAAMQRQSQESVEVEAFLAELKLDRYVRLFMEHGFDCMEVVREMQETHMRDIGMAPGHIIKLRKRLTELNPAPPQPARVPAAASTGEGSSPSSTLRRVTFGGTETKEAPKAASDGVGCGGTGSLFDGPGFDEAESAASFQEALRAWRDGGSSASKGATAKEAGGTSTQSSPKAVGSFWSTVGGAEVDLVRASTPLGSVPKDLRLAAPGEGVATQAAPSEEKVCCYQCYKQFFARYAVERTGTDDVTRRLCSEACAEAWIKAAEAKAEAQRKRREQLEKMQEMQRALEHERAATQRIADACGGGYAAATQAA